MIKSTPEGAVPLGRSEYSRANFLSFDPPSHSSSGSTKSPTSPIPALPLLPAPQVHLTQVGCFTYVASWDKLTIRKGGNNGGMKGKVWAGFCLFYLPKESSKSSILKRTVTLQIGRRQKTWMGPPPSPRSLCPQVSFTVCLGPYLTWATLGSLVCQEEIMLVGWTREMGKEHLWGRQFSDAVAFSLH